MMPHFLDEESLNCGVSWLSRIAVSLGSRELRCQLALEVALVWIVPGSHSIVCCPIQYVGWLVAIGFETDFHYHYFFGCVCTTQSDPFILEGE